jgi:uncharacterized protein
MKKLKKVLGVLCAFYLLLVGVMYFTQSDLQYFPREFSKQQFQGFANEKNLKISSYISYDGEELSFLHSEPKDNKPTIIFFNGNGGTFVGAYEKLKPLIDDGYGVVINIYKGYDVNKGNPSQETFYKDSISLYDKIVSKGYKEEDLIIYGYSIGSASAVYLASQKPKSKAIIIESGCSSVEDVAKQAYAFVPVSLLLKDKFPSDKYVKDVSQPKLHIHGNSDIVVPIKFGKRLYNAGIGNKEFVEIDDGTHYNLHNLGSIKTIKRFINIL